MVAYKTRRFALFSGVVFFGVVLYAVTWETAYPQRWSVLLHETTWPFPKFKLPEPHATSPPRRILDLGVLMPQVVVHPSRQYEVDTFAAMRRVYGCLATYEDCSERPEGKVVIVAYEHFWRTTSGSTGGETIWCESLLTAFKELGYSVLTATNVDMVLFLYRLFPDLVRVVIMQLRFLPNPNSNFVASCFNNRFCIQSANNPTGIAPWKIFGFSFWETGENALEYQHPWGTTRVLSPYRFPKHYYIGYAISHHCTKTPVVAPENRTNHAFILAKESSYFHDDKDRLAFPLDAYATITEQTGIQVVTTANESATQPIPAGVEKLGHLTREEFYHELSYSKVLIGIGRPFLSPSPFDALCLGVPFINPYNATRIKKIDGIYTGDIWNPFIIQHGALAGLRPPFVYHVPMGNTSELVKAVREAVRSPIQGRGLPEEFWMDSLMARVKGMVEDTDWGDRARRENLF